ncbi:MAG: carboxypeptidase-like regulatory domain-containing protein [Bacteroidales bacterium]|nr:carboxypeptidase-like regulatory domain-containing protein [Bacteroidales bacterium]
MNRRFLLLIIALLLPVISVLAQSYTISGTLTDSKTGETLIGATVVDTRSGKGTVSNAYGHFSLTLRRDSVGLKVHYVGYEPQHFDFYLDRNRELSVRLRPSVELAEVTITAERVGSTRSAQISATEMTVEKIKSVPVLFGEADIIKTLQLMPGVQSGSEGNSGMYVRGGGPDENLYLLDGVPLYNISHLGGFFSAFNTDAVKNVTLYKGSFPARFGGRLSSVVEVTQNNGNDRELHGNASIGFISAKFNLEGPIVKERTTFNLSARRTYAELTLLPLLTAMVSSQAKETASGSAEAENASLDAGYYFYDLNAKLSHKFSERSRLYGSFYLGQDHVHGQVATVSSLGEDIDLGMQDGWGNLLGSLRWSRTLTPRLFLNASASYSQYTNSIVGSIKKDDVGVGREGSTIEGDYRSGIRDLIGRADFDYTPVPEHGIKFGLGLTRHWFQPEVASISVDYYDSVQMEGAFRMDSSLFNEVMPATELEAYVEDEWSLGERVKIDGGLHWSGFRVESSFYPSLEPRLSGRVMLTDDLSVKVGYARMSQYVHMLSTSSISLPTDLWVPVTDRVKPMVSRQVAGGLFYSRSGIADFSVEGYYKRMQNLIEYKDGATFLGSSEHWENLVYAGDGWSYGIELLVRRDIGKLTGWVAYTWSRTMRQFDREGQVLNDGKAFPAKYDRRHDVSIVLSYKPNDKMDFSATWVFSTGNAATLTTQRYPVASDDPSDYETPANYQGAGQLAYHAGRNNYRLPDYHRLDLGANFHRKFKRVRRTINISIYNVYNRQNPYMIYPSRHQPYKQYPTSLMQLSLFPIIPSAAYTLYF